MMPRPTASAPARQRIAKERQRSSGARPRRRGGRSSRYGRVGRRRPALSNLGFKPAEASAAVAAAQDELGPEVELAALVRLALRKAAK